LTHPVPFCDLKVAHRARAAKIEAALLRVARSGRYVLGPELARFETAFARLCAVPQAVGVGSGTDALALILRASGVGRGDEVLVPALTAPATWMAVTQVGARPVGVEVHPEDRLIDATAALARVSPRTTALIGVDLFGRLAPWASLRQVAARHGLLLVEDAAHAAGVDEGAGPAGSLADAAAFSLYPTKPLGGLGDGGIVTTADESLAQRVRQLRSYGWSQWQGQAPSPGFNSRLDEIQAAVLHAGLEELAPRQDRLRKMAGRYRGGLGDAPAISLPSAPVSGEPPWHQFVITHPDRDDFRRRLSEAGVQTAVHYDPIPSRLQAFAPGQRFAVAEQLAASVISLPFDWWLSNDQVDVVCERVLAAGANAVGSSM
jgi:dTDP-3-amino-3,4,6-trideoxy-alpha-D-glucose transaminase